MTGRAAFILLSVALFAGCAAPPPPPAMPMVVEGDAPIAVDEGLQRLTAWAEGKGGRITASDVAAGRLWAEFPFAPESFWHYVDFDDYADCGDYGATLAYSQRVILATELAPTANGLRAKFTADFRQLRQEVFFGTDVPEHRCNSTGKLEREALAALGG